MWTKEKILDECKSGDEFTAKIDGIAIKGVIHIDLHSTDKLWLCHNSNKADGDTSPNKHGFKYSWAWDRDITEMYMVPKEPVVNNTYTLY